MNGNENKKGLKIRTLALELMAFVLLLVLDIMTKLQAVRTLQGRDDVILIPGTLQLHYLENRGAAFGMLQGQQSFFLVIGLAFMFAAAWFLIKLPADKKYAAIRAVIVAVSAGAAGNLIDRARMGYVVDFIYFSLIDFPVFNVADIYVTVGTFVAFILVLFVYKEDEGPGAFEGCPGEDKGGGI